MYPENYGLDALLGPEQGELALFQNDVSFFGLSGSSIEGFLGNY